MVDGDDDDIDDVVLIRVAKQNPASFCLPILPTSRLHLPRHS